MEGNTAVRRRLPIEVRRTQVLDAALRLISARGYASLSVESVAREAGVSKTVVYDAYGGLGAMLKALLEREERSALQSLAAAAPDLAPGSDPARAVKAWALSLCDAVTSDPVTWRLMLIPPDGTPETVREHVQRGRDVALAQARLLVGAAPDPELAARVLIAAAEECAKLLLDRPDEYPPERLARFAEGLLAQLRQAR